MNRSFFEKISSGFYGMDGGNLNADLWISGLEWGGENSHVLKTGDRDFITLDGYDVPCRINYELTSETKSSFDQKTAKIILSSKQNFVEYNLVEVKEYISNHFFSPNGDFFKLNLFPLNCNNFNSWNDDQIHETGCPMKYQYLTYSIEYRFPFIKKLVEKYNPKIILCYGEGHINEFMMAFWGEYDPTIFGTEFPLVKSKMSLYRKKGLPSILVSPFPGRNLVHDESLSIIGNKINELLNE